MPMTTFPAELIINTKNYDPWSVNKELRIVSVRAVLQAVLAMVCVVSVLLITE